MHQAATLHCNAATCSDRTARVAMRTPCLPSNVRLQRLHRCQKRAESVAFYYCSSSSSSSSSTQEDSSQAPSSSCRQAPTQAASSTLLSRRCQLRLTAAAALASSLIISPAIAEEGDDASSNITAAAIVASLPGDALAAAPASPAAKPAASPAAAGADAPVAPNLSVQTYMQLLQRARRQAWLRIAQAISAADFQALADLIRQRPFEDLRLAALYIPWALLQQDDYAAAVACRKAYVDLLDHVQDMEQIAVAAAQQGATAQQVQQAFLLLSASLDTYLATVPAKYTAAGVAAAAAGGAGEATQASAAVGQT